MVGGQRVGDLIVRRYRDLTVKSYMYSVHKIRLISYINRKYSDLPVQLHNLVNVFFLFAYYNSRSRQEAKHLLKIIW